MIDFTTLRLHWRPNQYLVTPPGHGPATPHRQSPRFAVPPAALHDALRDIVAGEPRTKITAEDRAQGRIEAVCRSRVFRFPDLVSMQILPAGEGGSTLLVYSRARYGVRDFGVNRARVERWLERLAAATASS